MIVFAFLLILSTAPRHSAVTVVPSTASAQILTDEEMQSISGPMATPKDIAEWNQRHP
ncbi:MAG: hypothetical protein WCO23_00635 [bacterium]